MLGAIIVIVAVVISALRRPVNKDNMRKFGDGYFYFMAFVALFVIYWGAADLIRIILEKAWLGGITPGYDSYNYYSNTPNYAYEQWLRGISLRVSAVLVAFPIWFFHWHKATSRPKEEVDVSGKRAYTFAVVLVMGLSSIGMLIGAMYLGINSLLGITLSSGEIQALAYLLPYSVGALGLWYFHWKIWHAGRQEELAEAKKEVPAADGVK